MGSEDPVLIDWEAGLAFPCQRPAQVKYGVLETPVWRISPDREGERVNSQREALASAWTNARPNYKRAQRLARRRRIKERVVGGKLIGIAEIHLVRCDQRQIARIGKSDQRRLDPGLQFSAMTSQLDVKTTGKKGAKRIEERFASLVLTVREQRRDGAVRPPRHRDQAVAIRF